MQSLRAAGQVTYGIPESFLKLEAEFKAERQKKQKRGGKRAGKNRTAARPVPDEHGNSQDEDVDQLESDLEDAARMDEPARKKAKKSAGKGRRGQTKKRNDGLSSLPVEVLSKIAEHLTPGDLLALANTTRILRSFFLSSSATTVWQLSRARARLPEFAVSKMGEQSYAELVYGKRCQGCGKHSSRMPDCFLKIRLCKPCKSSRLVKLDNISKTHPELHHAVASCVLRTPQLPTQPSQLATTARWALLSDLEREDEALWKRQERDDADEEARLAAAFSAKKGACGGSRSRTGEPDVSDGGQAASVYSYEIGRKKGEMGKRVTRYVEKRKEKLLPLEEEGKLLFSAVSKLAKTEAPMALKTKNGEPSARRTELEQRVRALEEGWEASDFKSSSWLSGKLTTKGPDVVSEEEWKNLRPDLLKLLKSIQQQRSEATLSTAREERQIALRPFYQQHRRDATFFPLFPDYLLLPSVIKLWQPKDAIVNATSWKSALIDIDGDLEDWQVSVHLHTVQLILAVTADIEEDETLDSDADACAAYEDDFFEEISSSLVCWITGCYRSGKNGSPSRSTFIGSLFDLFAHQHAEHSDLPLPVSSSSSSPNHKKLSVPLEPSFRFTLPLEVATAMDALCEIFGLTAEEETLEELDAAFDKENKAKVAWYIGNQLKGKFEKEWRKVMCHVNREAEKARKAKPPRVFIPTISVKGLK
ncbi:hypothetical protein JCM11641_006321 [Rhodosporidiobolus odoratus]